MTTEASICNLALIRIGVTQQIASLDETNSVARTCSLLYAQHRDSLQREYPWAFCETFIALALIEAEPNTQWLYSYGYPSDAMRINYVTVPGDRQMLYPSAFKIGNSSSGRLIYSDTENAVASYNAKVTDSEQFDPLFVDALAWKIAVDLGLSIAKSATAAANAQGMYREAISKAAAAQLLERRDDDSEGYLMDARK